MQVTAEGKNWMPRNTANKKMETKCESYFKNNQIDVQMITFQ